jgi:hypothetical protein
MTMRRREFLTAGAIAAAAATLPADGNAQRANANQDYSVGDFVLRRLESGLQIRHKNNPTTSSGRPCRTAHLSPPRIYNMLNEIVQQEPATSLDAELMGPVAAIGIIKGKPFAPDERMKKILTEAVTLANATSRTLFMNPRDPSWFYYPGSSWSNLLFQTGYEFETPLPQIAPEGAKPYPPTGYRTMNARTNFFYGVTGITPGMAMRVTGIGSQYLLAMADADKNYFDGSKTYKAMLPKDIPEANFWSFTVYDNQTRSMLDTPQRYPRAGSQSFPSPAAHQKWKTSLIQWAWWWDRLECFAMSSALATDPHSLP